ncbi:MAG: hypothetical protein ACRECM_09085, partial [Methyloceanibacter sp.]
VAKLWARSKIASLEARLYAGANAERINKSIETVALEHHLVSSQTSLVAIDKTKSRPDGQGVAGVDMPVNLPDGWVYDKVFGPQGGTQHAMKAAGRPASYDRALMQNPSGAGMLNSLMPSAAPQLAFDGGAVAATESAPADIDAAPSMPDPAQRPDTVTAAPTGPNVGQANYPLLPLTVVPKPDGSPLAALKAPHDPNQRIAILALVLALLSAVTFILWRYHRRDYASPRRIGRRI